MNKHNVRKLNNDTYQSASERRFPITAAIFDKIANSFFTDLSLRKLYTRSIHIRGLLKESLKNE
jgi:hypothetical protein